MWRRLKVVCLGPMIGLLWVGTRAQDSDALFEQRMRMLIQKNGSGVDLRTQTRLLAMREADQNIRSQVIAAATEKYRRQLEAQEEKIDRELTRKLKAIVAEHGWPTIRLVGLQASQTAALILAHSSDHDFQRTWIPQLSQLAESDQIVGSDVAGLIDRLLVSEGKPQRFGTQFAFRGDSMAMMPVEDPEHLDQRRVQYLLPPMPEYRRLLEGLYHKKVN